MPVSRSPALLPAWASKVAQSLIRRLYESDARGRLDDELLTDVGSALYSRCLSIIMVTNRQVSCPRCDHTFATNWQWDKRHDQMHIRCSACDRWEITGAQYRQSVERDNLAAMMALPVFQTYVERWPRTTTQHERMLLIDRLIHDFHWGLKHQDIPHRATANNLIVGDHDTVIAFLDHLSHDASRSPEMHATHTTWQQHAQRMQHFRQASHQPRAYRCTPRDEEAS
jgi:hypothetical protein